MNVKTEKLQVPAETRRLMKQLWARTRGGRVFQACVCCASAFKVVISAAIPATAQRKLYFAIFILRRERHTKSRTRPFFCYLDMTDESSSTNKTCMHDKFDF